MTEVTVSNKACTKCKVVKVVGEFGRDKSKKSGLQSQCKECVKKRQQSPEGKAKRQAYEQSPEWKAKQQAYFRSPEGKAKQQTYKQSAKGKAKRNVNLKQRYQNDPIFRLECKVRSSIKSALKTFNLTKKGGDRTNKFLGCTMSHYYTHIENQFYAGPTGTPMIFENDNLWDYDHIIPKTWFPETYQGIYLLSYYKNMQPKWLEENRFIKSNNYADVNGTVKITRAEWLRRLAGGACILDLMCEVLGLGEEDMVYLRSIH